jgi:hypothetical protein
MNAFHTATLAAIIGLSQPAFAKELITGTNPLDSFRPVEHWHGVESAEAVPDKNEITTSGKGPILVNGLTKDKTLPYLYTKEEYGDARIEMEFMIPKGSNSGIYVMGRYEVQIFDSFGRERVGTGDMGGIYQRMDASDPDNKKFSEGSRPMTNATKPPGEWQKLDILFRAPRFNDEGQQRSDAFFEEVRLNGVVIQKNFPTSGPTTSAPMEGNVARAPVAIQGDHGPIAIRSLRVTPVEEYHTTLIPELDAYWAEVSRSVREGDFDAYVKTCHPEAVLISGQKQTTQPMTTALSRWKKDFADTKEGRVRGNVEFRFGKRTGDFSTAHEIGIFRYTTLSDTDPPKYDYMHLDSVLVKRDGTWQILIENQLGPATEEDWNALR